ICSRFWRNGQEAIYPLSLRERVRVRAICEMRHSQFALTPTLSQRERGKGSYFAAATFLSAAVRETFDASEHAAHSFFSPLLLASTTSFTAGCASAASALKV